ncbi:PilN domain-containing protein [Ramlibacter sp.]|uniref:PilN domain-containing protein n=1 Tax=Ramlibacter sp. TaxID=1917967 RepID=UPI00262DC2C4|nr:PilN domain-containing protein [Ramlibacter sp.]MDB5954483.1 pilN [Ramlibacter sp.]
MILINLLPHREAARKLRREMFYAGLGAAAVTGAVIAGGIWLWYGARISNQEDRNRMLTSEIKKLDSKIKDIASLQEEIAALRARQQAVEDLQADRNMPVHLLNELSRLLPDGVYVTSMKQTNDTVAINGVAQSNERVSELLRNLGGSSQWLSRPELVEIVAGNVALTPKDQRRVANFRMNVKLVRASEAQKAASAASAASAAPTSGSKPPLTSTVAVGPAPVGSAIAAMGAASATK